MAHSCSISNLSHNIFLGFLSISGDFGRLERAPVKDSCVDIRQDFHPEHKRRQICSLKYALNKLFHTIPCIYLGTSSLDCDVLPATDHMPKNEDFRLLMHSDQKCDLSFLLLRSRHRCASSCMKTPWTRGQLYSSIVSTFKFEVTQYASKSHSTCYGYF